jgi:cytochrome c peroxidase
MRRTPYRGTGLPEMRHGESQTSSGKMAGASCHDPKFAFGPPNELPVQLGGRDPKLAGIRAVLSLRYLQTAPPFSEHYEDEDQGVVRSQAGRRAGAVER